MSGVFFLQRDLKYSVLSKWDFSRSQIYSFSPLAETFSYRMRSFRTLLLCPLGPCVFSRSLLITYLLTLESWKKVLFLKEVSNFGSKNLYETWSYRNLKSGLNLDFFTLLIDFRSLIWLVQSVIPKHTVKEIDWRKQAISTLHWWLSENAWNIWDTTKKIRKLIYLMFLLILFALKLRTLYLPGDTGNFTEKWLFRHPIRTHVIHEPNCIWSSSPWVLRSSVVRSSYPCTEGHRFNSFRGLRFFFVPGHALDMLIT